MIPYGKQQISQQDIDAVVSVLNSSHLTQGQQVPTFEEKVANYCQANFGIAVNSATSALHIACLALGLGKGDWLWTSPNSFVASANCGLYCGARIDFVDIDLKTGNISVDALAEQLVLAQKNNRLPKVLVVVHFAGQSCEMNVIKKLADQYDISIIEDASHAIGGRYQDNPIGNCQYSDITVFSFHPVKIVTTGEGGLALTNCPKLAEKMRLFRSHGVTADAALMTEASHGPWYYQQIELGLNYRMTELQAALGISQLDRLNEFTAKRNQIAAYYDECFKDTSITPLQIHSDCYSAYHLYVVLLPEASKSLHNKVITVLRGSGIFAHVHYIPIHTQPYYQKMGFNEGDFPVSESYYQRAVTLPLHPALTREQQDYIIDKLLSLL